MNSEALIGSILPTWAKAVDTFDDHDAPLFPAEEDVISRSVERRRVEFTTARYCARKAMGALGVPPQQLLTGMRGEPIWPRGVVGSITHCPGYRAAVVASRSEAITIGIDAEPDENIPSAVFDAISQPAEREDVRLLSRQFPATSWDRLLFCAKEAVYKAWFPVAKRWLDFDSASVTFDPLQETFFARLLVTGPRVLGHPLTGFKGRWVARDGFLITAIALSTQSDRAPVRVRSAYGPPVAANR